MTRILAIYAVYTIFLYILKSEECGERVMKEQMYKILGRYTSVTDVDG